MGVAPFIVEFTIPSDLSESRRLVDFLGESLQGAAYTEDDVFRIKLALEEALTNAITHGNRSDRNKCVRVGCTITAGVFGVRITDEGPGFNHNSEPDPTEPTTCWEVPRGSGLLLMRTFMTEVQFHGRGNVVTMTKVRETAT